MLIRHFTHPYGYDSILSDGYIDLEGCNAKKGFDAVNRSGRRLLYKSIGRHIWFTQDTSAKTASSNQISLTFNSEDIGAIRWSDYKKRFKNSKSKWQFVEALDESARQMGDNSNDFWVVSKPVSITKLVKELETQE